METLKEEFWQKAPNETAKILAQIKQFKGKVESYKNIVNEIEVVSDFVGESEKCSFMKSENFYTWE